MTRQNKYGSYDPRVKSLIARTGCVNLFPSLKIPRTTALYWIEQGFEIEDPVLESLAVGVAELNDELAKTKAALLEANTTIELLKEVHALLGHQLNWKKISSTKTRDAILGAIAKAMMNTRRAVCLSALGLSLSRFKRWKREKRGCGLPNTKSCPKYSRNQLTFQEIQKMGDLVIAKEYAHFPIRSLHYFAQRNGILFCTYSTWRKYIDLYGWLRPRKKRIKKCKDKIGIRAARPNEIWHLDLSYFILPDGSKAFVQVVVDNFSRYVLAWQVLRSYDGSKTAALLEQALLRASSQKLSLIVDGGSENKGPEMRSLEALGRFKKKVARFEISFSNSMVEAVFRSSKHNYLLHQEIKSVEHLETHCRFWFREHNQVIPHTAFKGETPLERFSQTWSKDEEIRIVVGHKNAINLRIQHNQEVFCKLCDAA